MPKFLARLREQIGHTADLRAEFDQLNTLHDQYAAAETDDERRSAGAQIAGIVESIAGHLDASPLARATTFLGSPEALRADAALWRSGQMYVDPIL